MAIRIQWIPGLKTFSVMNLEHAYMLLREELQIGDLNNYRFEQRTVRYGAVNIQVESRGYQHGEVEMASATCAIRAMDTFERVMRHHCKQVAGDTCVSSRFLIEMMDETGHVVCLGRGDVTYQRPQSNEV